MQKIFLLLTLILFSVSSWAEVWTPITPLPHCQEFKIEYLKKKRYLIRYRPIPGADYLSFDKKIDNINNLSELADEIIEISYNYCPLEMQLKIVDEHYDCVPQYITPDDFGEDFTKFYESIIAKFGTKRSCDNVIPLIELQDKIANLDQKQILDFKDSFSFFKIFVGKNKDKLIDHFNACGGSKFSSRFIENMILLEAKKSCTYPEPPGMLSLEEAIMVAKDVAKDYNNIGLMGLGNSSDTIKKKASLKFAEKILKNKTKELFGDEFDNESFIESLGSYFKLQKTPAAEIDRQLAYGFSQDVSLEIVEKGLSQIVQHSLGSQLPKDMTPEEKKEFIKNKILPDLQKKYQVCISPYTKRIKYPSHFGSEKVLPHRERLAREYCKKHPQDCNKNNCSGKTNYLTDRSDITDMNIIQSCLFPNLARALNPLIHKTLTDQFKSMDGKLGLTPRQQELYKKQAYNKLMNCADKKIKKISPEKSDNRFTEEPKLSLHLSADQFTDVLLICGKELEKDITKDISIKYISGLKQVKDKYKHLKIKDGNIAFAREITDRSLNQCLMAQSKRVTQKKVSAKLCQPMIETAAAAVIVGDELRNTLSEGNVDPEKIKTITHNLNECTNKVLDSNASAYYNDKHPNPIRSSEEAENYLETNTDFYTCIKSSINHTVDAMATKQLEDLSDDLQKKAEDPLYIDAIKPQIKNVITMCMKAELNKIPNWKAFAAMNEKDETSGADAKSQFEKIKDECVDKTTNFALPKIMANEVIRKLGNLHAQNLTELPAQDFAALVAKAYDVPFDKTSDDIDKVILKAFQKYKKLNPASVPDDFVADFSKKAQIDILGNIRIGLLDKIIADAKPENDFSFLKKKLSNQCLGEFYNYNKENIELLNSNNISRHINKTLAPLEAKEIIRYPNEMAKKDILSKFNQYCHLDRDDNNIHEMILQSFKDNNIKVYEPLMVADKVYKDIDKFCPKTGPKPEIDLRTMLSDLIRNGLVRAKQQNRLPDFEKTLEKMCKSPKKYQDIKELAKTGIADDFILAIVEEKTKSGFNKAMQSMCLNDLFDYMPYLKPMEQVAICSTKMADLEMLERRLSSIKFRMNYEEKVPLEKFNHIEFVFKRHLNSMKSIENKLTSDLIDRTLHKDKELLNYIYNNFPEVTKKQEDVISHITSIVVRKVFNEQGADSFASDFMQTQLTAAIGMQGHERARKQLEETVENRHWIQKTPGISEKIEKRAIPTFYKYWNYDGISNYLDWKNLPDEKRNNLINKVVEYNILPRYQDDLPAEVIEEYKQKLSDEVNGHIEEHKPFRNPNYKENATGRFKRANWGKPKKYNLAEKLANDITRDITEGVTSDLKKQFYLGE